MTRPAPQPRVHCPTCTGTGSIQVGHWHAGRFTPTDHRCSTCGGTGFAPPNVVVFPMPPDDDDHTDPEAA